VVEEPAILEAEITLAEQDVSRIQIDSVVELKAPAYPFETFHGRVVRIAPRAVPGMVHGTVLVTCRVEGPVTGLQPGMTGHARILCGERSLGAILVDRSLRFLRTEFWW
jgi:hypothetical protein